MMNARMKSALILGALGDGDEDRSQLVAFASRGFFCLGPLSRAHFHPIGGFLQLRIPAFRGELGLAMPTMRFPVICPYG
jgi:hypothetical protein